MTRDKTAQSRWPRILMYFLAAMLMLTLLSRAADSIMLPVVKCDRPFPGALSHTAVLSGVIEAREQRRVIAEPDLAVIQVHVRAGQSVKAGDALLSYDLELLQRKLEEKQAALKELIIKAQLEPLEQSATGTGGDGEDDKDKTEQEKADETKANQQKAALKQQISRLNIDKAQREVDRLSQLLHGGATLTAPLDGTIVKAGDATDAQIMLSPASSGLVVRASVTKDQVKHLKVGMEARIQRPGETRVNEDVAVLKGISPTATGYEASFDLPDGAGAIGQSISMATKQNTETYPMRVPQGAVVEHGGIKGVYRIRTGQSVLGDMEYAEFVPVEVIEADQQYAAISASLSDRDQVIVSSSKPLDAGVRVRSAS